MILFRKKIGCPAQFKDRVILITGAAGGLGRCLCLEFGRAGAIVAGVDVDERALREVQKVLRKEEISFQLYHCNITDEKQVLAALESIRKDLGEPYMLINNAGLSHFSLFSETELKVFRKVMEVNFFGAVLMTKACLPHLLRSRGQIVVLSSVAGFAPLIGRCAYASSKHAMQGFFNTLRTEVASEGLGVTIVSPAFIDTPIARSMLSGKGEQNIKTRRSTGRELSPERAAKLIFRAVQKRKKQLYLGRIAALSFWVNSFFPSLYSRLMVKRLGDRL